MRRDFIDLGSQNQFRWWFDGVQAACWGTIGSPCTSAKPCPNCADRAQHLATLRAESPFTRPLSPRTRG